MTRTVGCVLSGYKACPPVLVTWCPVPLYIWYFPLWTMYGTVWKVTQLVAQYHTAPRQLWNSLIFQVSFARGSLFPVVEVAPLLTLKHTLGHPQIGGDWAGFLWQVQICPKQPGAPLRKMVNNWWSVPMKLECYFSPKIRIPTANTFMWTEKKKVMKTQIRWITVYSFHMMSRLHHTLKMNLLGCGTSNTTHLIVMVEYGHRHNHFSGKSLGKNWSNQMQRGEGRGHIVERHKNHVLFRDTLWELLIFGILMLKKSSVVQTFKSLEMTKIKMILMELVLWSSVNPFLPLS